MWNFHNSCRRYWQRLFLDRVFVGGRGPLQGPPQLNAFQLNKHPLLADFAPPGQRKNGVLFMSLPDTPAAVGESPTACSVNCYNSFISSSVVNAKPARNHSGHRGLVVASAPQSPASLSRLAWNPGLVRRTPISLLCLAAL